MTYPVPDAALAQHTVVLGKTRAGKSSVMRGAVEQLLDLAKPVCIIDPKGDWWGLKSSADGKKAGYPVIIFGGDHADVPLNAHSGAHVAELVATGNRPCIIDLGGWMVGERTRFFIDFASTLFRHTRGPRHLVIDEVHNFAPQGKIHDPDAGKMLHWANRLASEGAGKGITLVSASQRPQKVHKDYLTSHETLIAMRVIHKLDRDAIKDWIDGAPDPGLGREVLQTLASMERGEGWAWSPEAKFGPVRIRFPMFKTYDSFAAPTTEAVEKLKGWASVDLDDVRSTLASVVEEAKANDPKALKAEVARLTRELAAAGKVAPAQAPAWPDQREEVRRLQAELEQMLTATGPIFDRIIEAADQAQRDFLDVLKRHPTAIPAAPTPQRRHVPTPAPVQRQPAPAREPRQSDAAPGEVPAGCAKPLAALAAVYPSGLTEAQWATSAGYKRSGGTWGTYKSRLRGAGLIESREGRWFATAAGAEAVGEVEMPPPPGPGLVRWWAAKLPGTTRMAEALIQAWPQWLSRDELAERVEMVATGGTFGTYISRLGSPGLIDRENGAYRLSAEVMGG